MFSRNKGKVKTKLSTSKKEIALIGFSFDIFCTTLFKIPILPVPMRIDKVTNGEPTCIIPLDLDKLKEVSESLELFINFKAFYLHGINNLINYAKETYKSIIFRELRPEPIIKWYKNSISTEIDIPSLKQEFTFIMTNFLETYSNIISLDLLRDKKNTLNELVKYNEKMLNHFRQVLEGNSVQFVINGERKTEKIYTIKKEKYYPRSIDLDVWNENDKDNIIKKAFVPYLIYDDLIDVFFYNLKLLKNEEQEPINLQVFEDSNIIGKEKMSDFYDIESHKQVYKMNLSELLKF